MNLLKQKEDLQSSSYVQVDEPVRLYLKDMGQVPLLSREGEIEIARQIETQSIDLLKVSYSIPLAKGIFNKWRERLVNKQISLIDLVDVEFYLGDKGVFDSSIDSIVGEDIIDNDDTNVDENIAEDVENESAKADAVEQLFSFIIDKMGEIYEIVSSY